MATMQNSPYTPPSQREADDAANWGILALIVVLLVAAIAYIVYAQTRTDTVVYTTPDVTYVAPADTTPANPMTSDTNTAPSAPATTGTTSGY